MSLQDDKDKQERLESIFRESYPSLYRAAYRYLLNREDALDLVQQAALIFVEAFENKSHLSDDKPRGYLYSILRCKMINFRRDKKAKSTVLLYNTVETETRPLEDYVFARYGVQVIKECIRELPVEYATYLELADDPEMSPELIAKILGVKVESLRTVASRARKLLKKACEAKGVEVESGGKRR